jgi:hypothetical protein
MGVTGILTDTAGMVIMINLVVIVATIVISQMRRLLTRKEAPKQEKASTTLI